MAAHMIALGTFNVGLGWVIAYTHRQQCLNNILQIEDEYRKYKRQTDTWNKIPFVIEQINKDKDWYLEEVTIQKEWIKRPWYRQILIPPHVKYS